MTINGETAENTFGPRPESSNIRLGGIETVRFTETSSPKLAHEAWRLHATSYMDRHFITEDAIADDGTLKPEIDHARGKYVQYYISSESEGLSSPEASPRKATLRKIYIPPGGGLDALPAYRLCIDSLYDEEKELLQAIQNPQKHVQEIGALAQSEHRSHVASFGAMRQVLQDSFGKNETWLFSIVESTYAVLVRSFGPMAIRRVGSLVGLEDEGVSEQVQLVPVILEVDKFLQNIYDSALQEDTTQKFRRQFGSLIFFSEGMPDSKLPDDVALALAPFSNNNITRKDPYTA